MLHSCPETSSLFLQHKEEGFHRNNSEGTGHPFAIGFDTICLWHCFKPAVQVFQTEI